MFTPDNLQYFLLILSGVIGILGITLKSKSDKGGAYFYSLTKGGVLLLSLCCIIIIINVFLQYSRSKSNALAIERQRNIFVQDSLKAVQNALMMTQRYQFDSLSHQSTITNLLQQKETDSLRYLVTMQKFGQQLGQQRTTLDNINRILNPLFPLKVQFDFSMRVNKFPDSIRRVLVAQGKRIFDSIPNSYADPLNSIWKIDYREVIKGKNELFTGNEHTTTLFSPVNAIVKGGIPNVSVRFFRRSPPLTEKGKKHMLPQGMTLSIEGARLEFNGLVNPLITYEYSWEKGSDWDELKISMRGLVDDTNLFQNFLNSISDLQGTDVAITYEGERSVDIPLLLDKMTIFSGVNFQNIYELQFAEEDNRSSGAYKDDIIFRQKSNTIFIPMIPG